VKTRIDVALRVAEFLGVSVEYLITGAEPAGKPDTSGAILNDMQAVIDHYKSGVI
jgi:hypothetical protein